MRDRGTVTAELALALPSVVMLLSLALAAGDVMVSQIQCVDAARAGARAAARGDSAQSVLEIAHEVGPAGAQIAVHRSGDQVIVEVAARVDLVLPGRPTINISSRAVAMAESS